MIRKTLLLAAVAGVALSGCVSVGDFGPDADAPAAPALPQPVGVAPGAPGAPAFWASAAKVGAGASYEAYDQGVYRDHGGTTGNVSRVWFSLADGVLTETMYGLIHQAQIKALRFAVATTRGVSVEGEDTGFEVDYLHKDAQGRPLSPAYRVVTTDEGGAYRIEKRIFTDPDRNALVLRVKITATGDGEIVPHLILEPHMANTGGGDRGAAALDELTAHEGEFHLALRSSQPFATASAGFLGASDALTDLNTNGLITQAHASTGDTPGSVVLSGTLPAIQPGQSLERDFVIGFGDSDIEARTAAMGSFDTGLDEVLRRYNGEGARTGWEDYLASLDELPRIAAQSADGGKLAYVSALMLKVQEDRTYAGALIASLSNPWGETVSAENPSTGYKAVWPRDFYQVAMAMLALGDTETPVAAFRYLPQVQVKASTPGNTGATGWFLQKTWVDGTIEWVGVQLDQTAMPIMLGWRLWKAGLIDDAEMARHYREMIKPAADFLVEGGKVGLLWNDRTITPPWTQQERWEEQEGHSPSTTAAVIAGLTTAADIARASGDAVSAARYLSAADDYASKIEARMFTTQGDFGDGRYFLRLSRDDDANNHDRLGDNNGRPGEPEDRILDGGFLELVRYGVRAPDAPSINATLPEYDDQTLPDQFRVRYDFGPQGDRTPGWRRYGNDGYGERTDDGSNYGIAGQMDPDQRGRVWPFFTGERGHYEIARAAQDGSLTDAERAEIRRLYVRGMERFASLGLMLPEQAWDGVGANPHGYRTGQGTDSATPLAWTHAEYLKLLRSLADGAVWDRYAPVAERYGTR